MPLSIAGSSGLEREVISRFGVRPAFFASAPDAPEVVAKLWEFAKSAYLDNPIPPLLKERLFVYLSRFCDVRYCIVRHCAFLLGYGHAAGDPAAGSQTIQQVITLLKTLPPWRRESEDWLAELEANPPFTDWPAPETEQEDQLFTAATLVFVEASRADRPRKAIRHALGGRRFEYLMGLLAFIRTAHYWTKVHPDLALEEDVVTLLGLNDELARLLLEDPEAARCDMGSLLFFELEGLRDLHERRELEVAKRALELQIEEKDFLLKEVNHRVKNSLQIVVSLLQLQTAHVANAEAEAAMRSASARILAIAAVHERLYSGDNVTTVPLDSFFADLCRNIGDALGCPDGLEMDLDPVTVSTDIALPLALIVNELVTNVIKYVGPPCRITLRRNSDGGLTLLVSDNGHGPSADTSPPGMGSRIVQSFTKQVGATMGTRRDRDGYTVEVKIPLPSNP